jgi:hypothetical protein
MAEEQKKSGEDANLNSNGQGDGNGTEGTQGDGSQKTTFTLEEVEAMKRKMQSDSERGVQKLHDTIKHKEAVIDAVAKISDDPKYLVVLSETNPEVAKSVLDKYYNGQSIDQFAESMGITIDLNDPEIVKKRIASEAQRIANERIISEKVDAFIEEFKMSDEEKEQFLNEFQERKGLKTFDVKDIRKHMEKAYREIDSDTEGKRKLEQQAAIGKALGTPSGKDASQKSSMDKHRDEAKSFLSKHNL